MVSGGSGGIVLIGKKSKISAVSFSKSGVFRCRCLVGVFKEVQSVTCVTKSRCMFS